jgi:hypothetical protein
MCTPEPTTCERRAWPRQWSHGLFLAACIVGVCGVAGAARAQDTNELPDRFMRAFSLDKIGDLTGLKKKEEEEKAGIDYRERSPLVVPRSRDLPPPEAGDTGAKVANWPKDVAGARKTKSRSPAAPQQPGTSDLPDRGGGMSFNASDWSLQNIFGRKKAESKEFRAEPDRETLTMPPAGYQTPSPDFAYGTSGPGESTRFNNPLAPPDVAPKP